MRRFAALLCSGVLLAACTGTQPTATESSTAPGPAATTSSPTPSPVPTTSPLSGRDGGIETPIIVVKYDNTPAAQPHHGLTSADIVYVEPVEWGLNRLAAVFSTDIPDVVGPVRSARIGDITMLEPLGTIALAFSGAQNRLWPRLQATSFHLFAEDLDSPGFYRERGRYAPVNLMAQPLEMLGTLDDVAVSHDIGLHFDEQRPVGGEKAPVVTATWPGARMQFRWNAREKSYDVWMDGRQARDVDEPGVQRATTVVVQYVKEVDSGYGDKFGGRTPLPKLVGSGRGLVLRDGRAYEITWQRPTSAEPTQYLGADGEPIAFDPGQVWIVLMDRTREVSVE